jgi:hemoglobin/transferrin/lactoferrin receptor protein
MLLRYRLIFFIFFAFTTGVCAQTLTVVDIDTGEPLDLVSVSCDSPKAFAITNETGEVDLTLFKEGTEIQFRLLGYDSFSASYYELAEAGFKISLESSFLNMDEVVVSASRWRETSGDVPVRVIAVSAREVALQQTQTAADLLGISGKVFIQKSQQGGGSPMIRGFATNRLLYSIDGVRMNTAIFRGGNIQNVISLDPFAMEQTEVVFGPGSVIYGSDAIGGVMSFKTLTPQFSLSNKRLITGKATVRTATANHEQTGHFHINVGWKKWSMLTSLSANNYDHLRMGSHGPEDYLKTHLVQIQDSLDVVLENEDPLIQSPSAYAQVNLMQKVRFKPVDNWDIQYGFHLSETTPYGRYDRHLRTTDGLPRYAEWKYGPQKWMMNNLSINHTANGNIFDQISVRFAHQAFEESRINRNLNNAERFIRMEEVGALSANVDMLKSFGTQNKMFYGVEYVLNRVTSTGIDENINSGKKQAGPSRYPNATWESMGAYISHRYKILESLVIQAGIRYNYFKLKADFNTDFYTFPFSTATLNKGSVSGSLGLVYRPSETLVLSTNLARGFRAPNVDDVGKIFDSEPGAVIVPNPDLESEYAYNFDLNLAKIIARKLKVDFSVYYTLLDNALVRRDFQLNGSDSIVYDGVLSQVQAIQNAAQAKVYGLQAGFEVQLPVGFGITSDFNIQVGEEELADGTKSPSRHAAPWFGVTRITFAKDNLNLQWYATYQGTRDYADMPFEERGKTEIYAADEDGNPYAPGWLTLNFKALYQFSEYFTVGAGIENITDRRYRPYSSGISAAGRNFILSFTAAF